MQQRYLKEPIQTVALHRHKMAFISGPRQVGKTTLAKSFSGDFSHCFYGNWDETQFRRLWIKDPGQMVSRFDLTKVKDTFLVILDEIHKSKLWKSRLKGFYDSWSNQLQILVTGSARLNVYEKGGDSLMGRYYHFRLHPLSYGELARPGPLDPEQWKSRLWTSQDVQVFPQVMENLIRFSGFPEPYFAANPKIMNLWRTGRQEKIIREDLRDLSRIPELSQVEMLASLLPTKIGSPFSVQSLREDLEVSFDTVKRWLKYLEELYYFFELKPWTKSVTRTLKKEGKIYLYDWTECEDRGPLFENFLAGHLLKAVHYWTDTGEGEFGLHYLRNKEKEEVDFLITRKRKPWLMVEAKNNSAIIDHRVAEKFMSQLGCPYVQVTAAEGHYKVENSIAVMSATRFLDGLP